MMKIRYHSCALCRRGYVPRRGMHRQSVAIEGGYHAMVDARCPMPDADFEELASFCRDVYANACAKEVAP